MKSASVFRPFLWLFCAAAVTLICFWLPIWLGRQIPSNADERPLAVTMFWYFPCVFGAAVVAVTAFASLWRGSRDQPSMKAQRIIGGIMLLVAAFPTFLAVVSILFIR